MQSDACRRPMCGFVSLLGGRKGDKLTREGEVGEMFVRFSSIFWKKQELYNFYGRAK